MKALSKVLGGFKGASKKDRQLPPMNDTIISCLCQVFTFIDTHHCDEEGLYRVPGDAEETERLYQAIVHGAMNARVLNECSGPHCIASAVKRVLASHEPLIGYRFYDKFVDADADYSELFEQLPENSRRLLDIILDHINNVVASTHSKMTYSNIAICFGMQLLRPLSADNVANDTDIPSATAELKTREKALVALFSSRKHDASLEQKVDSMIKQDNAATVQQRSVKITAPHSDPMDNQTQERLKGALHKMGNVLHVAAKDSRTLVAMYETRDEAEKCVSQLQVPPKYKIKLLDPTPVPFTETPITEVVDVQDAISDVEDSNIDSSPHHAEQTEDMIDSIQDVSTIKHKTLDSDVVYLNDFSSESERVAEELSIEDVSTAPSPAPPEDPCSPCPTQDSPRESPVSTPPAPKVIVRKDTARVIRVGGNTTGDKTGGGAAPVRERDEESASPENRSILSSDDNESTTGNNMSSSPPASPSKGDNDITLSNLIEAPFNNTYDVAAKLFNALDSDGCGVLEPNALLKAFNRNRKLLEWLHLDADGAARLVNSLRSFENDISLDDFIDLIYDAQQALDQTSVDSGGNASQQSVEEKQQDVEPKPSIPSTASRVPASKLPLPLLPASELPGDPIERLSAILLRNRRITSEKNTKLTTSMPPIKHPLKTFLCERHANIINGAFPPAVMSTLPVSEDEVDKLKREMLEIRRDYEQLLQSKTSELILHEQAEASYLAELTSARRRITDLESALMIEKDVVRRTKIDLCKRDAELKCLQGQTEDYASAIKDAAEREALSTVMAQQRLISLLESERDAALSTTTALKREVEALSAAHKEALNEALVWKEKYMLVRPQTENDENTLPQSTEVQADDVSPQDEIECLTSIAQDAVNKYLNNASKQQHKALNASVEPQTRDPVVVPSSASPRGKAALLNSPTTNLPMNTSSQREKQPLATSIATTTTSTPTQVTPLTATTKHEEEVLPDDPATSFIREQRNRFQQSLEAQTILSDKLLRNLASARKDLVNTGLSPETTLVARPIANKKNRSHITAATRREYIPRSEKFSEWYYNS